jgi:hypothetical protein
MSACVRVSDIQCECVYLVGEGESVCVCVCVHEQGCTSMSININKI